MSQNITDSQNDSHNNQRALDVAAAGSEPAQSQVSDVRTPSAQPAQTMSPRSARQRRWWVLPSAVLVAKAIAGLGGGLIGQSPTETDLPITTPLVQVSPVIMHDEWQRDRRLIGRVESRRSSDLGFEIGGTLIELQVDEGHTVAAGDPLGRIDDARLAAQAAEVSARLQQAQATLAELIAGTRPAVLEQAKAQVLLAEASRDLAAANLRRSEELHARDALSTQQLDESRFNVASAEAEVQLSQWRLTELERGPRQETILAQRAVVASLEKQVAQIAVDQEKTYLKAPFDGIVARRFRDEGEVVAAGTPVLQVLESSAPRIRLGVPPALVETINQHAQGIKITYQSHSITARLDNWLPDRDPATRTHVALLTIELPSEKSPTLLTSGDLVTALVPMPITTHGVRVPLDALREGERGTWNSLVAVPQKNAPHILESRPVLVVHTDGESAIVRGALNPGELLVTDGLHRVTPGMHVRVATTNSQQESLTAEVGIR